MKRTLVAVTLAALVGGMLVGSSSDAFASCPRNKAAKLEAEFVPADIAFPIDEYKFSWFESASGEWNFAAGDELVFDFSIIPFRGKVSDPNSSMAIWMNRVSGGSTFFSLSFADGTIGPTDLAYHRTKWNDIRVRFDFDAHEFTVVANGQRSGPHDFIGASAVTGATGLNVALANTFSEEPDAAWLDAITLTKQASGGDEELFAAQFEADPDFNPSYGTMEFVNPDSRELAQGACLTSTSLKVDKTRQRINASGRVLPPHPEGSVTVSLFKKNDGQFVKVSTKEPGLDGDSRYATRFSRPGNADRCRVRARFPAGPDYRGSSAEKTFDC
jgi:hypothetical protein